MWPEAIKTTMICYQKFRWSDSYFLYGSLTAGPVITIISIWFYDYVTGEHTMARMKMGNLLSLMTVGSVICAIPLYFILQDDGSTSWELTDHALIYGKTERKVFPLSSLVTIVPGLLEKQKTFLSDIDIDTINDMRKRTLLLKFNDGSMLPFFVCYALRFDPDPDSLGPDKVPIENGEELMSELLRRYEHLVDHHYQFSAEEIKLLQEPAMNQVISKGS